MALCDTEESVRQITTGNPRLTSWKAHIGKYSVLHFDAWTERTNACIQTMVLIFFVRAKQLIDESCMYSQIKTSDLTG